MTDLISEVGKFGKFDGRLEFPQIDSLDDPQARDVLRLPVREQNVAFTDQALDDLLAKTLGYPYFLQEWGYEVWNGADWSPITCPGVEAMLRPVNS